MSEQVKRYGKQVLWRTLYMLGGTGAWLTLPLAPFFGIFTWPLLGYSPNDHLNNLEWFTQWLYLKSQAQGAFHAK